MRFLSDLDCETSKKIQEMFDPTISYCNSLMLRIGEIKEMIAEDNTRNTVVSVGGMSREIYDILNELERDAKVYMSKINRLKSLFDSKSVELAYFAEKIANLKECHSIMTKKSTELFSSLSFI